MQRILTAQRGEPCHAVDVAADAEPPIARKYSGAVINRQTGQFDRKLRACAVGPELRVGTLPDDIQGTSRIVRGNEVVWSKPFLSGEANMSHWISNLEAHHFKYALFRQPGDVHVHMFGTATLSFADGIKTEPGDVFEIEESQFGLPLRNSVAWDAAETVTVTQL